MLQAKTVGLSLALSAVLCWPAHAELDVTSSTVPGLAAGAKLPDDAMLDVGAGETLRVMKSGKTYEIAGPYHGTLDAYSKRCSWWQSLLGQCSKPAEDVGATPAATRAMQRE